MIINTNTKMKINSSDFTGASLGCFQGSVLVNVSWAYKSTICQIITRPENAKLILVTSEGQCIVIAIVIHSFTRFNLTITANCAANCETVI